MITVLRNGRGRLCWTFTITRAIRALGSIRLRQPAILYPQLQAKQEGSNRNQDHEYALDGESPRVIIKAMLTNAAISLSTPKSRP
jgi:hypothetical protein